MNRKKCHHLILTCLSPLLEHSPPTLDILCIRLLSDYHLFFLSFCQTLSFSWYPPFFPPCPMRLRRMYAPSFSSLREPQLCPPPFLQRSLQDSVSSLDPFYAMTFPTVLSTAAPPPPPFSPQSLLVQYPITFFHLVREGLLEA